MALNERYVTITSGAGTCDHIVIKLFRKSDNVQIGGARVYTFNELKNLEDDELETLYQIIRVFKKTLIANPSATKAQIATTIRNETIYGGKL